MSATIEELPTTQLPARPPVVLRPSVREALWGFVFIGPWLRIRRFIPVSYTHLTLPTILRV